MKKSLLSVLLLCVLVAGRMDAQARPLFGTRTSLSSELEHRLYDASLRHLGREDCTSGSQPTDSPYVFRSFYYGAPGYIFTFTSGSNEHKTGTTYGRVWFDDRGNLIRVSKFRIDKDNGPGIELSGRSYDPGTSEEEEDNQPVTSDYPDQQSGQSNPQSSTGTNQYLYVPNSFDCSTFNSNPCNGVFENCNYATTKLHPYYPGNANVMEVNMPIYNDNTCSINRKLNSTFSNINYPCTNSVNNNFRRFCYQPNTAEYASLFIYHYGPKFYEDMMPLMGSLPGNLTIRPLVNNPGISVLVHGTPAHRYIEYYGVENGTTLNLGTDMYYVLYGMSLTLSAGPVTWQDGIPWIGMSAYMAQSYINAVYPGTMFGASNSAYVLNKHCYYGDLPLSIGTFFLRMENDPNYSLGRDKVHSIIKNVVEFGDLQSKHFNNFTEFAYVFYTEILGLNTINPSIVSDEDVIKIKSVLIDYLTSGGCPVPTLSRGKIYCDYWSYVAPNAKIYPYYPDTTQIVREIKIPDITVSTTTCSLGRKLGSTPSLIPSDVCCSNYLYKGTKRYCYDPVDGTSTAKENYSRVFSLFRGNQFLDDISIRAMLGDLIGQKQYSIEYDSTLSMSGFIDKTKIKFGKDSNYYAGTDLYYVVSTIGRAIIGSENFTTATGREVIWQGFGTYIAQSYIEASFNGEISASGDGKLTGGVTCENDSNQSNNLASVLMAIEKATGRELTHKIVVFATKNGMGKRSYSGLPEVATLFFNQHIAKMYTSNLLNKEQLCNIRNTLLEYFHCINLEFDPVSGADYFVPDFTFDQGLQPNLSNTPEWYSPAIINRQKPDGLTSNQSAIANTENTLYIQVKNTGCEMLPDAILQVYYSLSLTGLSWESAWINKTIAAGNETILAGDLIAEVPIPAINQNPVTLSVVWTPPDIGKLNLSYATVNILARIVSANDPMHTPEVKDVRSNVRNNNNLAWKVLNLEK